MSRLCLLLLLLCYLKTPFANAVSLLKEKLANITTLSANFLQDVRADGRSVTQSRGTMLLKRPGQFLWHTKTPLEQEVIADGKRIWVYDVDLEQVTIKAQKDGLRGTAALFLSGAGENLAADFSVERSMRKNKERYVLKARHAQEHFNAVWLWFDGAKLIQIDLFDKLGQHTIIELQKIQINPTLSSQLFKFSPPSGVDVIEQ